MKKDHTHLKKFVRKQTEKYYNIGFWIGASTGIIAFILVKLTQH